VEYFRTRSGSFRSSKSLKPYIDVEDSSVLKVSYPPLRSRNGNRRVRSGINLKHDNGCIDADTPGARVGCTSPVELQAGLPVTPLTATFLPSTSSAG
jgi:hypothetical protein